MKKHNTNTLKLIALFIAFIFLTSCDNNDDPVVEEELITTVITTLTNGDQTITLTYKDLDGDGPNAPSVLVSGNLMANTTYEGSTIFLNETETPAENITEEIQELDIEHQIFYQAPSSLGSFNYVDFDIDGKPLGLEFDYLTGNTATGNLTVTLRHLPNKSGSGVSNGDITNAGGSTDVVAVFPIVIQ